MHTECLVRISLPVCLSKRLVLENTLVRLVDIGLPPLEILAQELAVRISDSAGQLVELDRILGEVVLGAIVNDTQPVLQASQEVVALYE